MIFLRVWVAVWFAVGCLFGSTAGADEIVDTATELTILMVGTADADRITAEIDDATLRVQRRYDDDGTVTMTTTEFINEEGIPSTKVEYADATPSYNDILARLEAKLVSVKRSMETSDILN